MHRKRVARICEFARRFRAEPQLTPRQIYEETGYGSRYAEVSQEDIEAAVARDPTLVVDWLSFSEDKRWTPAWVLGKLSDRVWVVSLVREGGETGYQVRFASPVPACALMIRMEMEDLRLGPSPRKPPSRKLS
jgi:hypothetical protein